MLLGFYEQGIAKVQVDYIGPAELEGSDDERLATTLSDESYSASAMTPDFNYRGPIDELFPRLIFD